MDVRIELEVARIVLRRDPQGDGELVGARGGEGELLDVSDINNDGRVGRTVCEWNREEGGIVRNIRRGRGGRGGGDILGDVDQLGVNHRGHEMFIRVVEIARGHSELMGRGGGEERDLECPGGGVGRGILVGPTDTDRGDVEGNVDIAVELCDVEGLQGGVLVQTEGTAQHLRHD